MSVADLRGWIDYDLFREAVLVVGINPLRRRILSTEIGPVGPVADSPGKPSRSSDHQCHVVQCLMHSIAYPL
jgi:hypothetical protein